MKVKTEKEVGQDDRPRRVSVEERKQLIIEATKNVLSTSSYRGATTARIAAEAGINEALIYRHFPSKEDLFLAVLDDIAAFMIRFWSEAAAGQSDPIGILRAMGSATFEFIHGNRKEAKIFFLAIAEEGNPRIRENFKGHIRDFATFIQAILDEGQRQGWVVGDLDTKIAAWELMALGITSAFFGLLDFEELFKEERALKAIEDYIGMVGTPEAIEKSKQVKGKDKPRPGGPSPGGQARKKD